MTSDGLGEMFEGYSADMCAGKCPLMLMGGLGGAGAWAEISYKIYKNDWSLEKDGAEKLNKLCCGGQVSYIYLLLSLLDKTLLKTILNFSPMEQ